MAQQFILNQDDKVHYGFTPDAVWVRVALQSAAGRSVGAAENMITIRFWILSILFALIGVATLKIR